MRRVVPTHRAGAALERSRTPGVADRRRRRVISRLRWVARRAGTGARRRRFELLLCDRAAAVRSDLLEIAALLEVTADPDPACVADLHKLLTDGCASPLYNWDVHPSELRATLFYARDRLS